MTLATTCWCGSSELQPFNADYCRCPQCETLILREMPAEDVSRVRDDDNDLYGKSYYLQRHKDHGYPEITARARSDLPERCLHWLRTLLKFKRPPAKVLELGSGHGGFVAMLRWAGYDATGLELSPWLVRLARDSFNVPMLQGPVEDQSIESESLDAVALLDVLEHLPNPEKTIRHCLSLLKPGGVFLVQTPCYLEGMSFDAMDREEDAFLAQLKPDEHLYLFSKPSVTEFFARLGLEHVVFERPIFPHYDMYFLASREALVPTACQNDQPILDLSPRTRLMQALLDCDSFLKDNSGRLVSVEADRRARLEVILRQQEELAQVRQRLDEVEADRAARLEVILRQQEELAQVRQRLDEVEADRAARLEVILRQQEELAQVRQRLDEVEADRAARLEVILQQQEELAQVRQRLDEVEADRAARLEVILQQQGELAKLRTKSGALTENL